jgi:hypothetical protein
MDKLFRALVLMSVSLYVLWFFSPQFWSSLYGEEVLNLLSWNGFKTLMPSDNYIFIYGYFTLQLCSTLGLFFYQRWAMIAFTLMISFSILSSPFYGVSVNYGYEILLNNLITTLDGAIIVLMFFTSINNRFKN